GVAVNGDTRQSGKARLQAVPYPHRYVLKARDREPVDVVEHAVVERLAQSLHRRLELGEIDHESGARIGGTFHRHSDPERMAVHPAVRMVGLLVGEEMRRVEGNSMPISMAPPLIGYP